MHMIASLVTEDVYRSLKEHRRPDPADYARRLNEPARLLAATGNSSLDEAGPLP